ncbi:flagellar protein [Alteribacter lacisalsi]|jgi:predicted amidophosphoribosyltransferase|uniref:Flagellar protein n=1 Tax=Alteribacter lacisalsi TaxID=2045244 RepID=A0A2W0HEW5_9BACI|nr:flagellar protein [Alteribacter lacisalsi]
MKELSNCENCGKLFITKSQRVCIRCYKESEMLLKKITAYLDKNPKTNLHTLVAATSIPGKKIISLIKKGRIRLGPYPALHYPCEMCGAPVMNGKICSSCRNRLKEDLRKAEHAVIHEKAASAVYSLAQTTNRKSGDDGEN